MSLRPLPVPGDLDQTRSAFSVWQQACAAHSIAMRAPPPEPDTCCGRGCNGCVWEGYYAAASFWFEDATEALRAA